jgi:ABC-type lipoprotein release transport system permease subunit
VRIQKADQAAVTSVGTHSGGGGDHAQQGRLHAIPHDMEISMVSLGDHTAPGLGLKTGDTVKIITDTGHCPSGLISRNRQTLSRGKHPGDKVA